MRHIVHTISLFIILLVTLAGCGSANQQKERNKTELLISAATSLKDSLEEVQLLFEAKNPHIKLTFNFASSGTLQQQIEQGAPSDLFLSAGQSQMQALTEKGLIHSSEQKTLLLNELVAIIPFDSKNFITDMIGLESEEIRFIALGDPETVPAGQYTKEALISEHVWDNLREKFVYTKDVRQVLSYVEQGNADLGFVYQTDSLRSKKVKVVFTVNSLLHKPIEYPIAMMSSTKHKKESRLFYHYIQEKEARLVFKKYGFVVPLSSL